MARTLTSTVWVTDVQVCYTDLLGAQTDLVLTFPGCLTRVNIETLLSLPQFAGWRQSYRDHAYRNAAVDAAQSSM